MSEIPSFLKLDNIPLYECISLRLSIHPLKDTWTASTFWPLWIMQPWLWMYKYLRKTLLSILLHICPEAELLDHMAALFLTFGGPAIWFFTVAAVAKCSSFSTSSLRHLLLFVVAFASSHNFHFSDDLWYWGASWPFIYLLWKNVY